MYCLDGQVMKGIWKKILPLVSLALRSWLNMKSCLHLRLQQINLDSDSIYRTKKEREKKKRLDKFEQFGRAKSKLKKISIWQMNQKKSSLRSRLFRSLEIIHLHSNSREQCSELKRYWQIYTHAILWFPPPCFMK